MYIKNKFCFVRVISLELYSEFNGYRMNNAPVEKHELVNHWTEDLKLENYFQLVPESNHRQKTLESVLEDIENDPSEYRKMKKILKEHSSGEINIAIAMYWAIEIPEMLNNLQMPFDKDYELANTYLKL